MYLILVFLALFGLFAATVFVVSKVKKCSLEQSVAIVWKWITSDTKTIFALDAVGVERVLEIVSKHSRLDQKNTLWRYEGFQLIVQIIPKDENSVSACMEEAKTYIWNIATVSGCNNLDLDAFETPYIAASRAIVFCIASTESQKTALADYRRKMAKMATIEAGAGLQPFTDQALQSWKVMLGYDAESRIPIECDFAKTGHLCAIGGTGSGKSVAVLYFLYKLLDLQVPVDLYIGDFKRSGDYTGISSHFVESEQVVDMVDEFYNAFEATQEGHRGLKILLLDEYAGMLVWLSQKDKRRADEIRGKIANLLMLGRSRHCYVWCVQQRITATLFPSGIGAIDNFQICVGMGSLSPDSRRSLFAGEFPEDTPFMQNFKPVTGQGIILIDGQRVRPFAVPRIENKRDLITQIQEKAQTRP